MNTNELADGINSPHNACCYRDKCRQLQAENKELKTMRGNSVLVPSDKLKEMQAEIAELKHMNKNWQISEGMALAEIEALKAENQALKLCETNYPLEKHSKEWFQQQLARSDKIIFMERKLSSDKLDGYRKSKEQVKKKQEIIEQQQAEIEALKEQLRFSYDGQ